MNRKGTVSLAFAALALVASVAPAQLPIRTVATLDAARCTSGELENKQFSVSDGATTIDCTTGSGTATVICVCDAGVYRPANASLEAVAATDFVPVTKAGTQTMSASTAGADIDFDAVDNISFASNDFLPTAVATAVITSPVTNIVASTSSTITTATLTAAVTTAVVDAGGSADEVTVTAGETAIIGKIVNGVQSETCADSGDGSASTLTLTPTGNVIAITNSDADGCTVTMSETGADAGHVIRVVVISNAGTTVNFADTAGVSEIAGAFAAAVQDSITMAYVNSTWVELGRSNN